MALANGMGSQMNESTGDKIFPTLDSDDPANTATEIESLCVSCGKNGITKLLLTKIPYYKEVVLMSFECSSCGFSNNEIQSAGTIEEKGVRVTLNVESIDDLNRQVIKSDYACIKFPHLQFEIPPQSQKGEVTTVEGIISRSIQGLSQEQEDRKATSKDLFLQIDSFISKLEELKNVSQPYVMVLEDISGNSWIENPHAPKPDPNCRTVHFTRSHEEDHTLGVYTREEVEGEKPVEDAETAILPGSEAQGELDLEQEVMQFFTNCPSCSAPTTTNMKLTKIPYFKEVVIMATNCDSCGHRTNEVKSGAGIEPQGVRIEVTVTSKEDFSRDLLKSETCSLILPELEIEVGSFIRGGKFTTVEGLLFDLKTVLEETVAGRDSLRDDVKVALQKVVTRLSNIIMSNSEPVTIILDDPAGNSYIQSLTSPDPDPALKITHYERSFDQNEDLGLNDMKTENYEEDCGSSL